MYSYRLLASIDRWLCCLMRFRHVFPAHTAQHITFYGYIVLTASKSRLNFIDFTEWKHTHGFQIDRTQQRTEAQ